MTYIPVRLNQHNHPPQYALKQECRNPFQRCSGPASACKRVNLLESCVVANTKLVCSCLSAYKFGCLFLCCLLCAYWLLAEVSMARGTRIQIIHNNPSERNCYLCLILAANYLEVGLERLINAEAKACIGNDSLLVVTTRR
jgi:hypothetical protein